MGFGSSNWQSSHASQQSAIGLQQFDLISIMLRKGHKRDNGALELYDMNMNVENVIEDVCSIGVLIFVLSQYAWRARYVE